MMSLKRLLIGFAGLVVLGLLAFFVLAYEPAIAPITPPPAASFPADLVARGEALAGGGYCTNCHTAKGWGAFAGGYAMQTPFGVIYSTNITPDPQTDIGTWSEAAFARAMRDGVARDGSYLFPAFPYTHFTKLSDDDVQALYAYLMTRAPVQAPPQTNGLPFPLNMRVLQAGWRLLFFHPGRFQPDPARDAAWNRGAYLAQGLSHCGACHTPRNFLGAEKDDDRYAGAPVDEWIAPPLTAANPAPTPWTQSELHAFLRTGVSVLHGTAAGPMTPVVHGLSTVPDEDVQAIAAYFATIDRAAERQAGADAAVARAMSYASLGTGNTVDADARLYTSACASCHYNAGKLPLAARPDLALNTALSLPEPTNLIQVMLRGIGSHEGISGVVMPGFAPGFTDSDVARIAAYLRRTRTSLPPWTDLDQTIASVRRQIDAAR